MSIPLSTDTLHTSVHLLPQDYLGTVALLIAGLSAVIGSIHFGVSVSFVGLSLAYSLQVGTILRSFLYLLLLQ